MWLSKISSEAWQAAKPWAWLVSFLVLVSPGILNYSPFTLMWDDAYYAHRIVCMNHAVYSFSLSRIEECLGGTHKSPAIELVGLAWGSAGGGELSVGLALLGLALLIWILVLLTYSVSVRSGIPRWSLTLAAACIGLTPLVREWGGSLMTDILVGWCSALAVMLIPLESSTRGATPIESVFRGVLWAFVAVIGVFAKITFGLFLVTVLPVIIYLRWRNCGTRPLLYTLLGCFVASLPGMFVWWVCGTGMLRVGLMGIRGDVAALWSVPGMNAGTYIWRYFTDLRFGLLPLVILTLLYSRGILKERVRLVPAAIVLAYLGVSAMGQNRETRYTLTIAISLPIALAWTTWRDEQTLAGVSAAQLSSGLLAGVLVAIPMVARPQMTPVRHAGELLHSLSHDSTATFFVATDGPEFNIETFQLARQIGRESLRPVIVDTLVYDAINKRSLEDSLHRMRSADYVLFLKPSFASGPQWSRTWASEYRAYAEKTGLPLPAPVSSEFDVFAMKANAKSGVMRSAP